MSKRLKLNAKCRECGRSLYYSFFSDCIVCRKCNKKVDKKLSAFDNYVVSAVRNNKCVCCQRKIANKRSDSQKFCPICKDFIYMLKDEWSRKIRKLNKRVDNNV